MKREAESRRTSRRRPRQIVPTLRKTIVRDCKTKHQRRMFHGLSNHYVLILKSIVPKVGLARCL